MRLRRPGLTTLQLLVVIAILGILFGMLLVAVHRAREAARQAESLNNLRQLALACHIYHDAYNHLPAGVDKNGYSAVAHLLPFVELQNLKVQFGKPVDDPANHEVRKTAVRLFVSNQDPQPGPRADRAPTNYLFNAGSRPSLKDNDGVFFLESSLTLATLTNGDGTANTAAIAETLKGDGGAKALDVRRQHVVLPLEALRPKQPPPKVDAQTVAKLIADLDNKEFATREKASAELEKLGPAALPALKKVLGAQPTLELRQRVEALVKKAEPQLDLLNRLQDNAGLDDWKNGRNIAGDRCASWLDGRFLQGTFTATRKPNDDRPDVNVAGHGGLSAIRSLDGRIRLAFCDGHVQTVPAAVDVKVWKALMTRNGGEAVELP